MSDKEAALAAIDALIADIIENTEKQVRAMADVRVVVARHWGALSDKQRAETEQKISVLRARYAATNAAADGVRGWPVQEGRA